MKLILFQIILFSSLCFSASEAIAQQAKAYETVKYTARIKNGVFRLDYADGYIGASKIRLVSNQKKIQLFTPQNGTPEANGNLVLTSNLASNKREIVLIGINEETEAPNTIRANYREKGRELALLFYKNKR
ncbi:MAG: hypothetical protein EOP46_00260 [Sphingobacteriaceae bacterium]|nr:MAG: hypothetical protein EOP46_00260 [Sphingobacteriaceae bacterium]